MTGETMRRKLRTAAVALSHSASLAMSSHASPTASNNAGSFAFNSSSSSSSSAATKLTASLLTQFQLGKRSAPGGSITSIDFSTRGDSLVTASNEPDESLQLYNVATAQSKKLVYCKRSGCEIVRFTHHVNSVLIASKNQAWDDSIRYLSLHDNKYLRYFKGHRDRVTSLSMSPLDDSFLSASLDRTMRLWDLRTNVCQGLMHIPAVDATAASTSTATKSAATNPGKVLVAHDPAGMVFAVACSPNVIKLFDSRSHDSGPFVTFDIPLPRAASTPTSASAASSSSSSPPFFSWSSLKFSPDGKDLLITTTEHDGAPERVTNRVLLIDSYEGTTKLTFTGHEYQPTTTNGASGASSASSIASSYLSLPFESSFSPDGSFVFAGSRSGSIHSWNAVSGEPVAIWNASKSPITAIQFCPTKMTLVAGDAAGQVHWWIPKPSSDAMNTSA